MRIVILVHKRFVPEYTAALDDDDDGERENPPEWINLSTVM